MRKLWPFILRLLGYDPRDNDILEDTDPCEIMGYMRIKEKETDK